MNLTLELSELELKEKEVQLFKTPAFVLLKSDGNVYVEIVDNCSKESFYSIYYIKNIHSSIIITNILMTILWGSYDLSIIFKLGLATHKVSNVLIRISFLSLFHMAKRKLFIKNIHGPKI